MSIDEAKKVLPLPTMLHQLGLAHLARKRACGPFHDDQRASFSMHRDDKGYWRWKCFAGCGQGDQINFLELHEKLSPKDAIKRFLELAGGNGSTSHKAFVAARVVEQRKEVKATDSLTATPKTFNWQESVDALTAADALRLIFQRGYSRGLCSWLNENGFIGNYEGCFAFPVHDRAGNPVACHYRLKDGSWRYFPQGAKVRPLVIGELSPSDTVHVFESQWDGFAFMDKSGERSGIIITRGASNGAVVADLIQAGSTVYVWTQSDSAGEKWERDVCSHTKSIVKRCKISAPHKDLNDWTRAGATSHDLHAAMKQAEIIKSIQSEPQKMRSQADRLIKAAEGWEFFHTSDHRCYACVPLNGNKETIAVRSRKFRALLIRTYHSDTGKAANTGRIEEAVAFFEGKALCSEQLAVHTRLARHGDAIYLDLANEAWEAVEITANGWRMVSEPPVKFRRARGTLALQTPTQGGSVSDLRPFVNVANDDDFALLVAFMLAALRPGLPCPVEVLHGEQGSAKSTTAKVQKKLLDPAEPLLRSLPRDGRDLYIAASNSWIVALDNVSGLPVWLSDDLCRLATGGGFATRELYSDDEEKIFSALRPIALNGIEEIATRSDLLDRCILLELPMIPKDKRRVEADFWYEFEHVRTGILGALLDAVVCGLKNLPTTRLESCPRMADFATWIVACEPALHWPAGTFLKAYERNRDEANSLSLDASVIGSLVLQLAEQGAWRGTATELWKKLGELAGEDGQRQAGWPKNGRAVSGRLKRIAPNLRAQGVMMNWLRAGGARQIQILQAGTAAKNSVTTVTPSQNSTSE